MFLPEMIRRHPRLPQMWRFFIDTWSANNQYYPFSGDTGHFASKFDYYAGVAFLEDQGVGATGHMSGVAVDYSFSGSSTRHKIPRFAHVVITQQRSSWLPFDLFEKTRSFAPTESVSSTWPGIRAEHEQTQWPLALLNSGKVPKVPTLWPTTTPGGHGPRRHEPRLFAKGLDLMPTSASAVAFLGVIEAPTVTVDHLPTHVTVTCSAPGRGARDYALGVSGVARRRRERAVLTLASRRARRTVALGPSETTVTPSTFPRRVE